MVEVPGVVRGAQQILFETVDRGEERLPASPQPEAEVTRPEAIEVPVGTETPQVKPNDWKGITVHRESWPMLVCREPECDRQFQTPWPLIMNRCSDHHDKSNPEHFRGQN